MHKALAAIDAVEAAAEKLAGALDAERQARACAEAVVQAKEASAAFHERALDGLLAELLWWTRVLTLARERDRASA